MNLENLLEDLEAEAFFAAVSPTAPKSQKILSAIIAIGYPESITVSLSSPLLGKDFIAGFTQRNGQPAWLIASVFSIAAISSVDPNGIFVQSELHLAELLEQKLMHLQLHFSFLTGRTYRGEISRVTGELIQVQSKSNHEWHSLKVLEYLVVENLSDLAQHLAT